jgi:hypothetical protein
VRSRNDKSTIADSIQQVAIHLSTARIDVSERDSLEGVTEGEGSLAKFVSKWFKVELTSVETHSDLTVLKVDKSTMDLLSTLRVTSKNNLCIGTLAQNLLGQASHGTSTLSKARVKSTTDSTSDICRVCDALSCNIVLSKGGLQS